MALNSKKSAASTSPLVRNLVGRRAAAARRERFIAQLGLIVPFQRLFNQLPGVHVCLKDVESRLIWGNEALVQRLNVHPDDLVGTRDGDYFPAHIAADFVRDDQLVLASGEPLLNRIAVWYNEQRILDWFVKNKLPLRNRTGRIVGLLVSLQSYEGMRHAHTPLTDLGPVIDHIRRNLGEDLAVAGLARLAGVSPRQLHRRFGQAFGLSVQAFLMKTRIHAAQDELMRGARSIAEIAQAYGFCDQSAFTLQFRRHTGQTPRRFRQHYTVQATRRREC